MRTTAVGVATGSVAGVLRSERVVLRAYVLFRLGGLLQVVIGAVTTFPHYRPLGAGVALCAVVFGESFALIAVGLRLRRVPPRALVAVDAAVMAGVLVVGGGLTDRAHGHTWAYFVYPFSLLASIGFGLVFTRLVSVFALAALPAAAYAVTAVAQLGEPVWNAVPNSVPYLVNAGVAWAVARALRRTGRELDIATDTAMVKEAELAAERERVRHARLLHDRVLQTLETLAREPWITDPGLHAHVRAEAVWLRGFVRGERPVTGNGDLASGLAGLAEDMARIGQTVEVHTAQLRSASERAATVPEEVADALVEATREALTNVVKHAGTARAVVRAELVGGAVMVSVLDNGTGFDPTTLPPGSGLDSSVRDRVAGVGGRVTIDSTPGAGTYIEMRVPGLKPRDPSPPSKEREAGS
ncbi:ATP-binding protein [Streptomyces scopuliridis]|uniref:ATP-binding protein n=1 Tax=Streptomyces scopuliridis TaxID=452529 RepID=A0ACD4ZNP0_9ACTN|nr:ATP-binding protein [Streptomyces scopuliridis]WSB99412.1 ATP-binding protein [Streptomyces scopuliridis]WSC06887.1 ATP-binding protein [Streptomyces scopuliridis]